MSVQGINGAVPQFVPGASGRLYLPGAFDFSQTLNIGQIIEGKVLRQFDDTRYLVSFGERERVVDSSVPLSVGDVLYGRVVGLGERVELQRVYRDAAEGLAPKAPLLADTPRGQRLSRGVSELEALLQRYQVSLSETERATLQRAARSMADPQALGWASALLTKLGLPVDPALLGALYKAQLPKPGTVVPPGSVTDAKVPEVLAVWDAPPQAGTAALRDLADGVEQIMKAKVQSPAASRSVPSAREVGGTSLPGAVSVDPVPARAEERSAFQSTSHDTEELASWILNAQTGGVVSHALGVLPLLVGGKLLEVNVAMFEQQRDIKSEQRLAHRQVVLSLHTERLGQVQVIARVAGEHVRVTLATDDSERTQQAAQYANALKDALKQSAWRVDEITYETRSAAAHNGVVRSIIEHVVSQDTLNSFV